MAVMMIMEWPGVTREQYLATREIVKWTEKEPRGALFHAAALDANGLRVTDLWESAEDFNAFVEQRLMAGVKQAGIQGEPKVQFAELVATFPAKTYRRID